MCLRGQELVDHDGVADGAGGRATDRALPGPVGPRGDRAAVLGEHGAGRLDRVAFAAHGIDEAHDQRFRESCSPAKKTVAAREDLDVLTQFPVLRLQPFDLRRLGRGGARPVAGVDVGLHHPTTHRLPAQTELLGHRLRRRGDRRVVRLMLPHQTHRPSLHLRTDLLRHDVILLNSERDGIKPVTLQSSGPVQRLGRIVEGAFCGARYGSCLGFVACGRATAGVV